MNIIDRYHQYKMRKELQNNFADKKIYKGPNGSLYMPSEAPEVPKWKIDGSTDFDKFIKRMGMTAVDNSGKEVAKYTMATRGSVEASKNVTMIIPIFKALGRRWTIIQEEARPIDVARNGRESRILAFPAGIIGDEAAFQTETATESAVRELTEETGMRATKIKSLSPVVRTKDGTQIIRPIMTSPGLTDEATYFFEATVKKLKPSTKAVTDGGVTRGWHFVPVKRIPKWLQSLSEQGKIASGQTLSAIALLFNKCKL